MPGGLIYISGKISGNPNYEEEFAQAEKYYCEKKGEFVFNPADMGKFFREKCLSYFSKEPNWEDYMLFDVKHLLRAGTLVSLPNWKESKGARIERAIAEILGLEIVDFVQEK